MSTQSSSKPFAGRGLPASEPTLPIAGLLALAMIRCHLE